MEELDSSQRIQLDALDEEYRRQFGAAVEYIKAEVGEGTEYSNEAATVVFSSDGAWFECKDLPMEFSGAAGAPVEHRFITDREAIALLDALKRQSESLPDAGMRLFSLLVLYTRSGIADGRNVYSIHFEQQTDGASSRPQEIGKYQQGVLPLVYKFRLDAAITIPEVALQRGVLVCMANVGEMNLLVRIPYEGEDIRDLSHAPVNPIPQ